MQMNRSSILNHHAFSVSGNTEHDISARSVSKLVTGKPRHLPQSSFAFLLLIFITDKHPNFVGRLLNLTGMDITSGRIFLLVYLCVIVGFGTV